MIQEDYIVEFRGSDFNGWTAISHLGRLFFLKDILGKWIEVRSPLDISNLVKTRETVESLGVVKVESPKDRKIREARESEKKIWGFDKK